MSAVQIVLLVIAVALFVYLGFALFKPERF